MEGLVAVKERALAADDPFSDVPAYVPVDLSRVSTQRLRDEYLDRLGKRVVRETQRLTARALLEAGAKFLGESPERMVCRRRTADLAWRRQALMVAVRRYTGWGLERVADLFERECHGTVLWAEKAVEDPKHRRHLEMQEALLGLQALFLGMESLDREVRGGGDE